MSRHRRHSPRLFRIAVEPIGEGRFLAKCADATGATSKTVIEGERRLVAWLAECAGRVRGSLRRPPVLIAGAMARAKANKKRRLG